MGEKPYKSAAQVKTTAFPSSRGSTNSLTDASLNIIEREDAFITYVEVLEDQVTALKYDATVSSVQTCLTVGGDRASPPAEIIAIKGTSDASAAIIAYPCRDRSAQK